MSGATDENRQIARIVADAFGGKPKVTRYWDDNHDSYIDIVACVHRPEKALTSYGTIGLSDYPLYDNGKEYNVRLEIVAACRSRFQDFDLAVATAAFCIINSHWFCYPGRIFPDVLSMHKCSSTMKHIMFVPPYIWEDALKVRSFKTKKVAWLMALPISETEFKFAEANGSEALDDLLVENRIDIYDLERPAVI